MSHNAQTAKPGAVVGITCHFRDALGSEPAVFDGGAQRTNVEFVVVKTTGGEKFPPIHQILMEDLPPETPGGAIVYCIENYRSASHIVEAANAVFEPGE